MFGQGGEPQYFAIRGARIVPVSGPPVENATVVMAHGVITAIGKDVAIPPDAWVVEGKGLTVYPGLFDSFTDVGIPAATPAPGGSGEGGPRRPATQEVSRGPEDRPGTTPWRSAADEVSLSDKRIESWRNAGFTTVVSAPKGGMFPGQASRARSRRRTRQRTGRKDARGDSGLVATKRRIRKFPGLPYGRPRVCPPGVD